ncbi:unnamed protein product [Brassica rapa]|uniref:Uncharacterized protein n=2 Tax=Brassica TaxID=3705 RepID=A0A8D9GYJ4_BRACM|nr:unnamed protein product [Brassica napus]CAG7889533.1 unnamed protein product [Brassica rapa]
MPGQETRLAKATKSDDENDELKPYLKESVHNFSRYSLPRI